MLICLGCNLLELLEKPHRISIEEIQNGLIVPGGVFLISQSIQAVLNLLGYGIRVNDAAVLAQFVKE